MKTFKFEPSQKHTLPSFLKVNEHTPFPPITQSGVYELRWEEDYLVSFKLVTEEDTFESDFDLVFQEYEIFFETKCYIDWINEDTLETVEYVYIEI